MMANRDVPPIKVAQYRIAQIRRGEKEFLWPVFTAEQANKAKSSSQFIRWDGDWHKFQLRSEK